MQEYKNFVELVFKMRQAQKEFFNTHHYKTLQLSKKLESRVDEELLHLRQLNSPTPSEQLKFNF